MEDRTGDEKGRLARFVLTPGNTSEIRGSAPLLEALPFGSGQFFADAAYDSAALRDTLAGRGIEAVIPNSRSRKRRYPVDLELYKARHLVENVFADLKQFRGIATRYCKLAATFTAMLSLCAFVVNTRPTRRGSSPHLRLTS